MTLVHRVLHPSTIASLEEYVEHRRGGKGLDAARAAGAEAVVAELEASGLRGRGGAGFPTGTKWRSVVAAASTELATTVVVNGAEGEPGTFKDRTILANDPYAVLEGALIAAAVVGANEVVLALKARGADELDRMRAAVAEVQAAGWSDGVTFRIVEGPDEYLYGEETAMLEVLAGRAPLPRIAPPYRRGVVEVVDDDADLDSGSGQSAQVEMAGGDHLAPPALVDNVETMANIARIVDRGAAWFRTEGTEESPGTIVCTITGHVARPGVGEVLMGTTLREAIEEIAGGVAPGGDVVAVMPGVSSAPLPASALDTPLTYEAMAAAGSGLGSAGFIVIGEHDDVVAAAAGASRFLAVESCGQCTACKRDGLAISDRLRRLSMDEATETDVDELRTLAGTVADGARCSLARQHEAITTGLLDRFADHVEQHLRASVDAVEPMVVAELIHLTDGAAVLDEHHAAKQPDWTFDEIDSGTWPAARLGEHRSEEPAGR